MLRNVRSSQVANIDYPKDNKDMLHYFFLLLSMNFRMRFLSLPAMSKNRSILPDAAGHLQFPFANRETFGFCKQNSKKQSREPPCEKEAS